MRILGSVYIFLGLLLNPWVVLLFVGNDKLLISGRGPTFIAAGTIVFDIACLSLGVALVGFRDRFRFIQPLALTITSTVCSVLIAEVLTYFAVGLSLIAPWEYQTYAALNRPCLRFDPKIGYRWTPGDCRIARAIGDFVIYDHVFHVNNQGFVSRRDYSFKKRDPKTHRIVVFGDSFMVGLNLQAPWPDRLQENLDALAGPGRYEVYSFAVDGGGLANWHRIFFKEIVPNYDFDSVVIAVFFDDLARPLVVWHATERKAFIKHMADPDDLPQSLEVFEAKTLPRMIHVYDVESDESIDERIAWVRNRPVFFWPKPNFYFLRLIYRRIFLWPHIRRQWRKDQSRSQEAVQALEEAGREGKPTLEDLRSTLGEKQASMLRDIVEYCAKHGKRLIFASVPALQELLDRHDGGPKKKTRVQRELTVTTEYFGLPYFDGYAPFRGVAPEDIKAYWLKHDGHWDQPAVDRHAEAMSRFLTAHPGSGP